MSLFFIIFDSVANTLSLKLTRYNLLNVINLIVSLSHLAVIVKN